MWARVVEIMTAVWLMLSPFVFDAVDKPTILWIDLGAAALIAGLAAVSFWPPLRYAHWTILLVALALVAIGRFLIPPATSPAQQNHLFVGLFLLMIAIVPNEASQPPPAWRESVD